MKFKNLLCAYLALGTIAFGSTVSASENIAITLMGKPVPTDSPPIYDQGRVLVPLRAVSEALGATVAWDQLTQTASVSKWTQHISLTLGKQVAFIELQDNGGFSKETVKLDVSVKSIHNRIYVPLRFVSEQYGYTVSWINHTVAIQSPLNGKEQTALYGGDLAAARKYVISSMFMDRHFEHPPLQKLHQTEINDTEFLFPKGEALRFFTIEDSEIATYYEYKDGFLIATWQAHIDPLQANSVEQLLTDKFTDPTGPIPEIDKNFLYYDSGYSGPSSWVRSGEADRDGKITYTGDHVSNGDVTNTTGPIVLTLADETRKETITTP